MNDINSITVSGRMIKDPEVKSLNNGVSMAIFTIANNYSIKQEGEWTEKANFIDCKLFGGLTKGIANFTSKGKFVTVQGELRQETWETKDGEKRSKMVVIANKVCFESSKSGNAGTGQKINEVPDPWAEQNDNDIPF